MKISIEEMKIRKWHHGKSINLGIENKSEMKWQRKLMA